MTMELKVVKFYTNDDGDKILNGPWHLLKKQGDAMRTVCSGEVVGFGETSALTKEKKFKKGSITCKFCIDVIKWYKSIDL